MLTLQADQPTSEETFSLKNQGARQPFYIDLERIGVARLGSQLLGQSALVLAAESLAEASQQY